MATTNAEFGEALGALLGLTTEEVEALIEDLDAWATGGATVPRLSRVIADSNERADQLTALFADWQSGTATGGPNSDGLYPLRASDGTEYLVASPAKIASAAVTITPRGTVANSTALSALTGMAAGDLYVVASPTPAHSWVRNKTNTAWVDMGVWAGPTGATGLSALQVVIAAGHLSPGSTPTDFANWLRDAQIAAVAAAVQPLVDGAEDARDASAASAVTAGDKADDAETARAAAVVAQGLSEDARDASAASAVTAGDKADDAETARAAAVVAQAAAEAARDEAGEIVGGDFVTGPEASTVGYVPTFSTTSGKALGVGRAVGAASDTDLIDRAAGDVRYRAAGAVAQGDVTGLTPALSDKAPLASPALTGTPTAPTAAPGTNSTQIATMAAVYAAVQAIIGMAPTDLDTLAEIAARLENNEDTDADNYAALVSLIGGKLAKASNLSDLTDAAAARTNLGLAALAVLATVGTGQIDADAVTFAKVQNIATARLLGRTTAGTGDVEELSAAAVKAFLAIAAADVSGLPDKAAGSDLRALADDAKFLTAKSVKDALAGETLSLSTPDLLRPVQSVTLSANSTLGDPTNVTAGTNGVLHVKQAATGGPYTLGYHTTWKPYGSTPSMPTTAGAVVAIMWTVDGAGAVRFAMTQAAAS